MQNNIFIFLAIIGPIVSILGLITALFVKRRQSRKKENVQKYLDSGFAKAIEGFVDVVNRELPDVILNLPKDVQDKIRKKQHLHIGEDFEFFGDRFATTKEKREFVYKNKGEKPENDD